MSAYVVLLSAQAALTKHHRLGGLDNRHLVLEARKSKVEVPAHSVLCESPFPGLQAVISSLCPHMADREKEREL